MYVSDPIVAIRPLTAHNGTRSDALQLHHELVSHILPTKSKSSTELHGEEICPVLP